MKHSGRQRLLGFELRQQTRERGAVSHIARRYAHPRAQRREFGRELRRAGSRAATTARQHQMLRSVPCQPARHLRSNAAQPSADQHQGDDKCPPQ